jgi:hypothetical protein
MDGGVEAVLSEKVLSFEQEEIKHCHIKRRQRE